MTMMKTILAGGLGLAAMAAAAPAAAQYAYGANPYGYSSYGYNPYGYSAYGYGAYGMNTSLAASQCSAAVQNRLYNRTSIAGILGAVLGANVPAGRVVAITRVQPTSYGTVRVRGLATSGRFAYNGYGPYGVGAYGALGYGTAQAADLSFRCDVSPNGYVNRVTINRRY